MEVIVMKVMSKEGGTMVTGSIGSGVGPLAGEGLDEALGLAVGLGPIGSGEAVFAAEFLAGGGEEFGAISGAAVGEQALDLDAVELVKGEGLEQGVQGAGDFFVWEEAGEGEAGMVVDGDVEGLDAGAWIAVGAVAGGADAGLGEAAELLDVEVEEVAGEVAFVAEDGRFGRFEGSEAVEAVAAQDAGEGGFGDGQDHADLGVGTALAAQGDDLGFELRGGLAGLVPRGGGMVREPLREVLGLGASEPAPDGLFADAVSNRGGAQGETELMVSERHLGSRQRGERGISVHVVRAGGRWVESSSTTSLPDPCCADNLLKHDI